MIRVRISAARGSTPREVGAEMMVTVDGATGSIGGGQSGAPAQAAAVYQAPASAAAQRAPVTGKPSWAQ